MARNPIHRAGSFEAANSDGAPTGLFADEDDFDRRSLFRLASWAALAVGAVAAAFYTSQSSIGWSREQVAAADLARQGQQIQAFARQGQNDTRRLASAIETLNGDRDRLYSRVSALEQGLDSVTGAITRQKTAIAAPPPPAAAPVPSPAPVATSAPVVSPDLALSKAASPVTEPAEKPVADAAPPRAKAAAPASPDQEMSSRPAAPAEMLEMPSTTTKPIPAALDAAGARAAAAAVAGAKAAAIPASPPTVVAAIPAAGNADTVRADGAPSAEPRVEVRKTEFAVDVGGANSLGGLRALWRGLLKSRSNAPLAALHPIIMIKEHNTGAGMQLRLGAGPLGDAAAAARICAVMVENRHPCETAVYDGQRLELNAEDAAAASAAVKPASIKPAAHRRSYARRAPIEEAPAPPPPPQPASPPPETTGLSTIFGHR
jgi:hypothetical protein